MQRSGQDVVGTLWRDAFAIAYALDGEEEDRLKIHLEVQFDLSLGGPGSKIRRGIAMYRAEARTIVD